jgi:hypothetical protein
MASWHILLPLPFEYLQYCLKVLIRAEAALSDTCISIEGGVIRFPLKGSPPPSDFQNILQTTHPTSTHLYIQKVTRQHIISTKQTVAAMKFALVKSLLAFGTITALAGTATAGPLAYGICQAGCAAVVTACYGAAGATWGATLAATAPATVLLCNAAFGKCSAACAVISLAPTP